MKNNLKTKVMLAVLAGGMLCANGAWADSWYGTPEGFVTDAPSPEVLTGVNLIINDATKNIDTPQVTVDNVSDYIYGGFSSDKNVDVQNNQITFNLSQNITTGADIYAGYIGEFGSGTVSGNKLIIGKQGDTAGGTFNNPLYGGCNLGSGDATGNSVSINYGTFNSYIYGGCSSNGNVTNNTVTINGGTFNEYVYGGYSDSGNATNNTVTINGGTFETGFYLYGGYFSINGKISSGNTLNLKTKIGGKATIVGYFQIMNFTLPSNIADGKTMLSTQFLFATKNEGEGEAKVNVYAADGVKLNKGDVITLIDVDTKVTGNYIAGSILGGAADFYFEGAEGGENKNGDNDTNDLVIVLNKDFTANDSATTKAIAEGIAASLAFVNQGADMVAGSGIDGLYVADSENPTIAAFSGNKTRYNTGSHVDIHGWNALAGVALNNKASFSHGVFVEIGNGDIDTYAALNGSGSSDYKGGGYMLRKDMGKGWTIDGAVRAGRVETSWGNDTKGGYEAKQTYYGAHVTFNKMLKEYGEQKLNGYLRYTFTHLGSDSVNLDGTHYGFDSVNSHRTRLGARMVDEGQNGFELYYGAAWEYGFGGDCDATVNGVTTSGPAVDGSNGVFEVGGTWSENKWEISAGLEGYVGAKRGVAGGMNFIYKF